MEQNVKRYTIPPKDRPEWTSMVKGEIEHQFSNFVLQMKISGYKGRIASGSLAVDEAIDELYELCEKYAVAVQSDFQTIFKEW